MVFVVCRMVDLKKGLRGLMEKTIFFVICRLCPQLDKSANSVLIMLTTVVRKQWTLVRIVQSLYGVQWWADGAALRRHIYCSYTVREQSMKFNSQWAIIQNKIQSNFWMERGNWIYASSRHGSSTTFTTSTVLSSLWIVNIDLIVVSHYVN